MNIFDKEILNKMEEQIKFDELKLAMVKNREKEIKKELKLLKQIKQKFEETGILYC